MLRAYQLGLTLEDLDSLSYGQVVDMITESANDAEEYEELPSQEDFDAF